MGEAFDDDFGDLYADVEAHVVASFSNGNNDLRSGKEFDAVSNGCESDEVSVSKPVQLPKLDEPGKEMVCCFEKDYDSSSDDSEDDLKILLNDENCEGLLVTSSAGVMNEEEGVGGEDGCVAAVDENVLECNGGDRENQLKDSYLSQYKYIRPNVENASISVRSIGKDGVASDWDDKEWNKPRRSVSAQGVQKHNWGNGSVGQGRYSFSLPRSRSILDVNIDALEEKPWRHPGVDATDFFNFGFNEQSWKDYCRSVEELRRRILSRNRGFYPSKYKAYIGGSYHNRLPQEHEEEELIQHELADHVPKIDACEVSQFGKSKGKTIEVDDCIGERQPSMNLWHPCYSHRDSDVVIQVIGSGLNVSTDEQEVGGGEKYIDETKENIDTNQGDNGDANSTASASGSKPSIDTLEGAKRRSPRMKTSSNLTSPQSENHGKSEGSDSDRQRHEKISITSEEIIGVLDISSYRQEAVPKDLSGNDPCIIQAESSLSDCTHSSHKNSCSGDHSGESEHVPHKGSEEKEKIVLTPSPVRVAILKRSPVVDSGCVGPSVLSDREIYNQDHPIDHHGRHSKRVHGLNTYGNRNTAYYRIPEGSQRNHGHGKTSSCYNQHPYETRFPRKNGHTFNGKRDLYPRKEWGGRKYLFQHNIDGVGTKITHRHCYGDERGYLMKDNHFTLTGASGLGSRDSYYMNEEGSQWKGGDETCYFRKRRINPAGHLLPENSVSFQFTGRRLKSFDERYLAHGEEDTEDVCRRKRSNDDTNSNAFFPESMDNRYDERGHVNNCSLSSQQYKESFDGRRKWHASRPVNNSSYEPKSPRTFKRYHAQVSEDRGLCSFDDVSYEGDNINCGDNHFQPHMRSYDGQLKYDSTHTRSSDKSKMHHGYKQLKENMYEYNVQRCRDTLDLVVREGQPSRRCSDTETVISCGHGNLNSKWEEGSEREELTNSNQLDLLYMAKDDQLDNQGRTLNKNTGKWLDFNKLPIEAVDIEEGQIVMNEPREFMPMENVHAPERRQLQEQNRTNVNKLAAEVGNSRILESLAKMKKRRERFKKPLNLKKELAKECNPQAGSASETTEINPQRPARKRRWVGF